MANSPGQELIWNERANRWEIISHGSVLATGSKKTLSRKFPEAKDTSS